MHPEGLPLILQGDVVRTLKKIYNKLQDAVPDEVNGILGKDDFIRDTTINGYRFHIRKEIHKQISNDKIVDKFAIEGKRDQPFTVEKATDDLRKQIVKLFGLEKEFPNLV